MQNGDWWRFNLVITSSLIAFVLLKDKTKLAESGGSICEACENFTKYCKFSLKLEPDKRQAVNGIDVLAV